MLYLTDPSSLLPPRLLTVISPMTEMCCELSEHFISALFILSAVWKVAGIFIRMKMLHNPKHNLAFSGSLVRCPAAKQTKKNQTMEK